MPKYPLLLEPLDLQAILDDPDLLILDTSTAANHEAHHIPGAVHIAPSRLQCGIKPATGKLPDRDSLSALFSEVGLTPEKHVISYDDEGGGWAGRLIWTLDVLGHRNYSYLNGGLVSWLAAGLPTGQGMGRGHPSTYAATIHPAPIATTESIIAGLERGDIAIWDARSAEEYAGTKVVAARGGHIPGAFNIDWLELIDGDNDKRLVDLSALERRLEAIGVTRDSNVTTHCQSHHRSGLTYLAMKLMGFKNYRGYDGSWGEWGNREDTPIETGVKDQ